MLISVAWRSLLSRKLVVGLTILLIGTSTFVLLGVEHIRAETRSSFSKAVSGVDLIVGARTGDINLLLYSVFRIGNASNNISWQSYQNLSTRPGVAWTVPISLGDSHRGYRVMGTTTDYFRHYSYGNQQALRISEGREFDALQEAVLGAEAARTLGYQIGDQIVLAHGGGAVSFSNHDDKPFTVVGILTPTGTPVDRTVHVSLESLEAIHMNWPGSRPVTSASEFEASLIPDSITAFMVGLESRIMTFTVQRQINEYGSEPLLAIMPGVALAQLWDMMGMLERVLTLIAFLVLFASLLGMSIMLLSSMVQRQREISILRAIGAHSSFIFLLVEIEALLITIVGVALGMGGLYLALVTGTDTISETYGLFINTNIIGAQTLVYLTSIVTGAMVLALLPALMAYRGSLVSGLLSEQ